jgi:hypothetical protein
VGGESFGGKSILLSVQLIAFLVVMAIFGHNAHRRAKKPVRGGFTRKANNGCPAQIPHRFMPYSFTAQLPHNRTIPHKFSYTRLHRIAINNLQTKGGSRITVGKLV